MKRLIFFLVLLGSGSVGTAITSVAVSPHGLTYTPDIIIVFMVTFILFIIIGLIGSLIELTRKED